MSFEPRPPDLVLRAARVVDDGGLVDIVIADGRVSALVPAGSAAPAAEEIDCAGRVVIPGLIEPHLHLDKALLDRERPNPDGTLAGAIEVTGELKRAFTHESVRARARRVLDQAVAHGTTHVRAHPDIDPVVGLLAFEVMLDLREEYRDALDLQIVAFPQEGIFQAPGTEELLREALRRGADAVGGCAYNEPDLDTCRRHVDLVFDLAAEFGVPADLHADMAADGGDPRFALAEYIAGLTEAAGMGGRVALGHVNSLAGRPEHAAVIERLAAAGVAVVPLPFTDTHLNGCVAPIRELWAAGVTAAYSSNNVRNAFTPFGNADPLDVGLFVAQTFRMSGADLAKVLDMATGQAARVIGVADRHGLRPGADADLVVLGTHRVADVLLDRPDRCYVLKRGRVVARTARTTDLLIRREALL
ncbi:amidohydrolase family protein [Spirillospora sp. NPDC047279]|uniref:amidohydrolase family protein n=1 Tax=Spirillospora sp. NPDC047279 TaxID=3155478 RepID=UPI0033C26FE1